MFSRGSHIMQQIMCAAVFIACLASLTFPGRTNTAFYFYPPTSFPAVILGYNVNQPHQATDLQNSQSLFDKCAYRIFKQCTIVAIPNNCDLPIRFLLYDMPRMVGPGSYFEGKSFCISTAHDQKFGNAQMSFTDSSRPHNRSCESAPCKHIASKSICF